MVGVARIELATPAMSTQCSTTELHAHPREAHQSATLTGTRQPMWLGEAAFRERMRGAQQALEPAVLVLGLEHAVDLHDQILQVERLGQELGFRRRAAALERDRGEAGDEH